MKITADLILHYSDEKTARAIKQSLCIDDETYVTSAIKQDTIHAHITSENLSSFLHTIDDYLSCLAVAEKIMKEKKKGEISE
jgi:tRNA threonylcarbamoyladenosine modification (KEOPS) complex  Pcc1 subunit